MRSVLIAVLCMIAFRTTAQEVIPLYSGSIPNSIPTTISESDAGSEPKKTRLSLISVPSLTAFFPKKGKSNGTAVIICPGGGYSRVVIDHEGLLIAEEFARIGVTAFVLKYRLPDDRWMADKATGPLQDAQQAIRMIREHAADWAIDPGRIGIMGFSAGGHLASTAGTHFSSAVVPDRRNTSLRPDFMMLIYPVISFNDSLMHKGSRDNLLGKTPSPESVSLYSNELQVTSATPPAFLVHAGDDKIVKVLNTIRFYEALIAHNVPAEMHIYPHGGHGFGLVNATTSDSWFERCRNWMQAGGWLGK